MFQRSRALAKSPTTDRLPSVLANTGSDPVSRKRDSDRATGFPDMAIVTSLPVLLNALDRGHAALEHLDVALVLGDASFVRHRNVDQIILDLFDPADLLTVTAVTGFLRRVHGFS